MAGLRRFLERWRQGRLDPGMQRAVRQDLRGMAAALARRELEEARARVERAHQASQNDPLLHTACHLGRSAVSAGEGRVGLALEELRLGLMAGPASGVRRISGLMPGQDNGPGLWATWTDRHRLRAASSASEGAPPASKGAASG